MIVIVISSDFDDRVDSHHPFGMQERQARAGRPTCCTPAGSVNHRAGGGGQRFGRGGAAFRRSDVGFTCM